MVNKLSFRKRMFISILAFSIPICILTFLMYQAQTVNINFGIHEKLGNQYQRPLESALRAISLHRLNALRSAAGDSFAKSQLSDLEKEGDQAFAALGKVNAEIGSSLEFTEEGLKKRKREAFTCQAMQKAWDEIKKSTATDAQYSSLIAGLRTMITHMGDTSNLILDPDLDSYYLMDITLVALPQTQDRIQDILANVEMILKKPEITLKDRVQIAVYAALLKEADISRIVGDSQTVINEDGNFYGTSASLQARLPSAVGSYQKAAEKFQALLMQLSDPDAALVPLSDLQKAGHEAFDSSFQLWNLSIDELDVLLNTRVQDLSRERTMNLSIAFLVLILACTFSIQIAQTLTKAISGVVVSLAETGSQVEESSGLLTGASQTLSSSTSDSAASLEESVASIEELSSMVSLNAKNSKTVSELSQEAERFSAIGEERIRQLISCMDKITTSSRQIEDIINVIDDIAFQTNLLALNAAVEAARAGEQGKGFAVVADSVRSLAQKSAEAAKEIATLIKTNVATIHEGAELADSSGKSLESIVASIQKVTSLNKEIAQACEEQSSGLSQITSALNNLDATTQKNAASSEEIAAASEVLLNESKQMQDHMRILESIVKGQQRDPTGSPSEIPLEVYSPKAS